MGQEFQIFVAQLHSGPADLEEFVGHVLTYGLGDLRVVIASF